jgi:mRNA-degrading endonuclease RelE of RelBE toxin-antitoxin system
MTDEANEYELVIARRFLKDMKRLAREDQVRVRKAIINIQTEPYRGRKVIAADTGQYRWRLGTCEFVMTSRVGRSTYCCGAMGMPADVLIWCFRAIF